MAGNKCQLKIHPWQDFSDTCGLKEPVHANFLDFLWDNTPIEIFVIHIIVSNDYLTSRILLGQLLHSSKNKGTEVIEDIGQKNELLWVENWRSNIVQQLRTRNGDSHTGYLIFLFPELFELSIQSFKLVRELLRSDHLNTPARYLRVFHLKLIHSRFTLAESDDTIGISIFSLINDDLLTVGLKRELGEDLEFLLFPGFELVSIKHHYFELVEVGKWISLTKFVGDRSSNTLFTSLNDLIIVIRVIFLFDGSLCFRLYLG
jgi:hypothetical protein